MVMDGGQGMVETVAGGEDAPRPPALRADFLNTGPGPAADLDYAMDSPDRFINRELSWLSFNDRVLREADDRRHPLLERLRFVAISGSNLDEFYTVRVAGLRELVNEGVTRTSVDGLTPAQQLDRIDADCRVLMDGQQSRWAGLRVEMEEAGIVLVERGDLTPDDREWLDAKFMDDVFPVLSPLAIDPAHPFPFVPSKALSLALQLVQRGGEAEIDALLIIPQQLDRYMRLPDLEGSDGGPQGGGRQGLIRFIALEDMIALSLDRVFPGYDVLGSGLFRVLRDSDIEIEEEAEDLVREFETALKRRRRGEVIRLKMGSETPESLRDWICREMGVTEREVVYADGVVGVSDLDQMIVDDLPDLRWRNYTPRRPERLTDFDNDCFAAIRHKDFLLHHPYETFDVVVAYLRQAARDPDVLAIKQTLYRTSAQSPIVEALCEAAELGKQVTALVELKARFDEAANIVQARQLERAGAQVVYGFIDWKTHAKMSSVVRREGGRLVTYTHYGTGNYHPITAKLYTDLSFFTADKTLARDAARVFNYVTGYAEPRDLEKVSISPIGMKARILALLEEEAAHARAGRPAQVWAKLNSIMETEVIDALYRASQAGVRIDLIIRGICGVRPGVKGLSENIRVKSVVGRYLEHSRIVCFGRGEGLPGENASVFISSADWMDRNLNRRVETLCPIENPTVKRQILQQVMAANLRDEANTWVMNGDGTYVHEDGQNGESGFDCHEFFMKYPSISGRGRVGYADAPLLTGEGE